MITSQDRPSLDLKVLFRVIYNTETGPSAQLTYAEQDTLSKEVQLAHIPPNLF